MVDDGGYEPYIDVETETIEVDSDTVRTVERSYERDSDGRRQLVQVIERQTRSLADGTVRTVRTTSHSDLNEKLEIVQQEVEVKKQLSPDVLQTTTSILIPEDGELKESARIEQRETRCDQEIEFRETHLVRDGNGGWQTSEVRQGLTKEDGAQGYKEENLLWPDSNGKMSVVQRTTRKETTEASGEKQAITETYSIDLPGEARDGTLHLAQRVTTVDGVGQGGKQSTQLTVEDATLGASGDGMRVTSQSFDLIVRGPDGIAHETRSVQAVDGSGHLRLVWTDHGTFNKPKQR